MIYDPGSEFGMAARYVLESNGGFPAPAARASAIEAGTKLRISNLDYGISNEDMKVVIFTLFI